MGHCPFLIINTHTHLHLLLLLLLSLLLLSSSLAIHSHEGRLLPNHEEAPKEEMVMASAAAMIIGSRPPRCEGRCISCGHCEAVQVPIAPKERRWSSSSSSSSSSISSDPNALTKATTSRGDYDDTSNYKPLNWKCKCGDLILNP
ncbi:EPIDERMAL PATTERNING FACTOR-like protein 2 [Ananas comosus]|uniref:Epidermal patterning factor-like protein n=1 Tax=Ananas comosus TaxID=4615 RepID=A0A6P5GFG1_ANACO|nr:EPIDERMAL PATTERNING FACTOR-like protein 2 [Ananas comosus]